MILCFNCIIDYISSMSSQSISPAPVVAYPVLVGKVIAQCRDARGITQSTMAAVLGLTQSAYSRLEAGGSVLNLSQLRQVAGTIGMRPEDILETASRYEARLQAQGVQVVAGKQENSAAVAIGMGLLMALLLT